MKRAPFLSAAVAAVFGSAPLARVAVAARLSPRGAKLTLVPAVPDPIPASVLAHPVLGEARRYAGAAAPRGWMLAKGQLLAISANPHLFSIFRTRFGGDGRTTFGLPNAQFPVIVAVTGLFPATPQDMARLGRAMGYVASLGPGAMPRRPRAAKPIPPEVLAARRLAASEPRVSHAAPQPILPALAARIAAAKSDARTAALQALRPQSRAALDAAVAGAVAGKIDVYGVVTRMAAALDAGEASHLLDICDGLTRAFNARSGVQTHARPILEAAHFLTSVAITRDDARAISRHEDRRAS